MTQTLLVVVLFVGFIAMLPWLIKRLQQRHVNAGTAAGAQARVLSAVSVGPQQRVVTVEVGAEHSRTCLVLGVTAQQITCLHVLASPAPATGLPAPAHSSFAQEVSAAQASAQSAMAVPRD